MFLNILVDEQLPTAYWQTHFSSNSGYHMGLSDQQEYISLLDSNEAPAENDISHLRAVLEDSNAKIAEIQSTIGERKRFINKLVAELDLLYEEEDKWKEEKTKVETILAPVRRIPDELVEQIFAYLPLYVLQRSTPSNSLVLGQICSRWRRIALGSPRLWNEFMIYPLIDSDFAADCGKKEIKRWKRFFKRARSLSQGVPQSLSFLISEGYLNIEISRQTYIEDESERLLEKVLGHRLYDIERLEISMGNFFTVLHDSGTEPLGKIRTLFLHGLRDNPSFSTFEDCLAISKLCLWTPDTLFVVDAFPMKWDSLTHIMLSLSIPASTLDKLLRKCVNLEVAIFTIACDTPKSKLFEPLLDQNQLDFKMLHLKRLTITVEIEFYDELFAPYLCAEKVPALQNFRLGYKPSHWSLVDVMPANYDYIGMSLITKLALVNDFRIPDKELLELLRRSPKIVNLDIQFHTNWMTFIDGLMVQNTPDSSGNVVLPDLQSITMNLRHVKGSDLSNVRNGLANLIQHRWHGQFSSRIENLLVLVDEKNIDRWRKIGGLLADVVSEGFFFELRSDASFFWRNPADLPRPSTEQESYLFDDSVIWEN
ncbi:hypothetical protein BDQ17DRAFT_1329635 [Cyathus striatus]|nr:hypothetical protein BDQ17DRAFT_1329635 [Cyathus striatus]